MKFILTAGPIQDEKQRTLLARFMVSHQHPLSFSEIFNTLSNEQMIVQSLTSESEVRQTVSKLSEVGISCQVEKQEEIQTASPKEALNKQSEKLPIPPSRHTEPISTISQVSKTTSKPTYHFIIPISAISIIILSFLIFIANKQNKEREFTIPDGTSLTKRATPPSREPLPASSSKHENEARLALDSADQSCGQEGIDVERLYRFAISFNKYNQDAWFGLLNCFRAIDKREAILETEKQMIQLFGDSVLVPHTFPIKYGTVEALELKNRTVSLVMSSRSDKNKLYSDLFQITRRFSSIGKFDSITILIKQPNGNGFFMKSVLFNCISYQDFIKNSTIETF